MGLLVVLLLVVGGSVALAVLVSRSSRRREAERLEAELAPVRRLAEEDVTALGTELQTLDADLAGAPLDEGARADYQRALDAYEAAKSSAAALQRPEDVRHVTEILEDGRYAMACVRARVDGLPLPARRPPCFFDPRHGLSVVDVPWTPPGGSPRDVPACALDAERVRAGAEPDSRKVMVGSQRVPYYQAGGAYRPYAAGYFGAFTPMDWMFAGLLFGGMGGFDALGAVGEGLGEGLAGLGEGLGDGIAGLGEGIGDFFDGFDF
ncbi:hypothetical protein [Nocardioides sp. GY 10127]|uniref:hypothetical protein n=1 Tax=Nocardioides sp. GY 10127 TaxID=2569762 RepID=UPI0010A767BA|nr:hypothetical protein [Nocardioides sp. GY 10127]TIC84045.1 hypothetical protein E8D37_04355 [Nocardioides sp. GY 10127]